jgi:hypothetical protein
MNYFGIRGHHEQNWVHHIITSLESFAGEMVGTIHSSLDYINLLPGSYTFTVFLTDMRRLMSSQVYGTFAVPSESGQEVLKRIAHSVNRW